MNAAKTSRKKDRAKLGVALRRAPLRAITACRCPGMNDEEFGGSLIVIEGMDGSGRSTQIALLTEWLESEGFAVETMGLRRSGLVAKDIDALLAENTITRMTLTLMYATDFYDQLEHRIIPALRSDFVVLADRYFYTLIARAAARGIERDYLNGLYEMAFRPDLTFWLNVRPEAAFEREFRKSHAISYWESGRDLSLSDDLFQSFIMYQAKIKKEFESLSERHGFLALDGEASVVLRERRNCGNASPRISAFNARITGHPPHWPPCGAETSQTHTSRGD